MTRTEYAFYVAGRIAESAVLAAAAGSATAALQDHGILHAPTLIPLSAAACLGPWAVPAAHAAARLAWPALAALAAHIALGPKQRRPVYRRVPGAMYAYAGVSVARAAGCRGGLTTGATGSGKTLACILPRLHSLCVNERGIERREWAASPGRRALSRVRASHEALVRRSDEELARLPPGDDQAKGAAALRARCRESACLLRDAADACRRSRYRVPPWGGLICGEKGNEWHAMEELLRCHGRSEDACVLTTRPPGSAPDWAPEVRLNPLSMDAVSADTFARMIVDTGLCVEESGTRDEFFVPQARDKIAWGIRLLRAVASASQGGPRLPPRPNLLLLLDILTVHESYGGHLARWCAEYPCLEMSESFREARYQIENNYWSQPPDQLGGVRSTLYNFLAPFSEPEIAEVFCTDSTFDLREVQEGKVVCLAIPQRHALQRRYVATLLKAMVYQVVLERFDRRDDDPEWLNRNVVLVEQDEWQRHAVPADCEVDIVREAQGAVYAATQSQNAVWLKLGGRESASPLIANLRNRWICQAASEECAAESSASVGGRVARELSHSSGESGRTTTVSFAERPLLPTRLLRALPPFHVVFAPAEGPWLYRTCIAMPATPGGGIPRWWFGDWNPLRWAAALAGRGGPLVPPWRARAPLAAQLRWLLGLDGTFVILGGRRAGEKLINTP